jgi:phosphate transport system substrate-binding protein
MGRRWLALRAVATLSAWLAGWHILSKYEYFITFNDIDNIIGMLPMALVMISAIGASFILWAEPRAKPLPLTLAILLTITLSAALFPTALRGNWWVMTAVSDAAEAMPDLSVYAPFGAGSKTAKLSERPELRFGASQPVLDGATALYPVYAAFAEALYDESDFSGDRVLCTNTVGAYNALISGERDIIFVAGASEKQIAAARASGADLRFTPIGREAFVFLVGKGNPLDDISYQQIRNIYSGKTAHWATLGWDGGGRIIAFQRPEGSGSQTGLQKIMGDLPIQAPQPLPDASLAGTNSLMKQVSVEWGGVQPAIGYSYRFYATTMYANPDAKLLRVNGVAPTPENIRSGLYPFVADFYAVTRGEPTGDTKLFIDWILSNGGQELIEKTGYVPLTK